VRVENLGPTADPGPVTITDVLPASLTPTSASGDGLVCTITGRTVTCRTTAPLAVGSSVIASIVADVSADAFPEVENTATVATPSPETETANNTATDVATVVPLIRLDVTKRVVSQQAATVVWGIAVRNVGLNATVAPIVVTDELSANLRLLSVSGDGWRCTGVETVVCTYTASVAAGGATSELMVTTSVVGTPGEVVVNVATADGGGPDTETVTADASVVTPACDVQGPNPPCRLPSTGSDPFGAVQVATLFAGLGLALWFMTRRRRVFGR
jgi:large repetitive protein